MPPAAARYARKCSCQATATAWSSSAIDGGQRLCSPPHHLFFLSGGLTHQAHGREVKERVDVGHVPLVSGQQGRADDAEDARQKLDGVSRPDRLVHQGFQFIIGRLVQIEGRAAQLGHACPQGLGVFAVEVQMQAEGALDLPLGGRVHECRTDLVQPRLNVVQSPHPAHVLVHAQPDGGGLGISGEAGERRDGGVRFRKKRIVIGGHGGLEFCSCCQHCSYLA